MQWRFGRRDTRFSRNLHGLEINGYLAAGDYSDLISLFEVDWSPATLASRGSPYFYGIRSSSVIPGDGDPCPRCGDPCKSGSIQ